jgi:hypothetical protein
MKLTEEKILKLKKIAGDNTVFGVPLSDVVETIEAQQQEIDKLTTMWDEASNSLTYEVAENESLQAQVTRMREALQTVSTGYSLSGEMDNLIENVLSDAPTEYHNPADIEALKLAREALEKSKTKFEQYRRVYGSIGAEAMSEVVGEALTAIEQIGGGKG